MVYICVIMIMIIQNNDTMVVVVVKRVSFLNERFATNERRVPLRDFEDVILRLHVISRVFSRPRVPRRG